MQLIFLGLVAAASVYFFKTKPHTSTATSTSDSISSNNGTPQKGTNAVNEVSPHRLRSVSTVDEEQKKIDFNKKSEGNCYVTTLHIR